MQPLVLGSFIYSYNCISKLSCYPFFYIPSCWSAKYIRQARKITQEVCISSARLNLLHLSDRFLWKDVYPRCFLPHREVPATLWQLPSMYRCTKVEFVSPTTVLTRLAKCFLHAAAGSFLRFLLRQFLLHLNQFISPLSVSCEDCDHVHGSPPNFEVHPLWNAQPALGLANPTGELTDYWVNQRLLA